MPDNIKMSLQNGLTICGLLLACGISYASIQRDLSRESERNDVQDVQITNGASERRSIMLGQAEYKAYQSEILRSLREVQSELKSLTRADGN